MMDALPYLAAVALLAIGFLGVLAGRNVLKTLIGIEIMSKAAILTFIATGYATAQGIVVLLILIDAIVVAVVMALAVAVYRQYDTLDSNALRRLTW